MTYVDVEDALKKVGKLFFYVLEEDGVNNNVELNR